MIKPRLKTSKKGTELPLDYIKMVKDVISKSFKKHLKGQTVIVEGMIYPEEVLLRIGFKENTSIKQKNFESSVGFSPKEKNVLQQINLSIDALGSMIDQYFTSKEDIDLPLVWTEFKMEGKPVYLQTTGENSDLEAKADEFLKNAGAHEDESTDSDD